MLQGSIAKKQSNCIWLFAGFTFYRGGGKDLNPFLIAAMIRSALNLKRTCPACKKDQVVRSDQKKEPLKCKFCGAIIPPRSDK